MSDDEEYYDEFDEDDFLWIEEPDPDMAASATSTYDPILLEDPCLEAIDFFSDWDELSDDYYDDDPTAVRRQRMLAGRLHAAQDDLPLRMKRRGLNIPNTDVGSFQGVVWKKPTDEVDFVETYAPGEGEKVALLKNWREVFKDSKPAIGRLRIQTPNSSPSDPENDNFITPRTEEDPETSLVEKLEVDGIVSTHAPKPPSKKSSRSTPLHASMVVNSPPEISRPPKSTELADSSENVFENKARQSSKSGALARPPKSSETDPKKSTKGVPSPRTRKRKASVSLDEQPDEAEKSNSPASKPRSKRVASSKARDNDTDRPRPVRRSARHKK